MSVSAISEPHLFRDFCQNVILLPSAKWPRQIIMYFVLTHVANFLQIKLILTTFKYCKYNQEHIRYHRSSDILASVMQALTQ